MFSELPLALFTTCASIGAGAFIVHACDMLTQKDSADSSQGACEGAESQRLISYMALPLVVTVAGFIAAFFHLAQVSHAMYVFANVGSSPLSNEILVGCIATLVAFIYWILVIRRVITGQTRKWCVAVVAVCEVLFVLFMGFAYMMPTIPTWNTIASPLQMLGLSLVGGQALYAVALGIARTSVTRVAGTVLLVSSLIGTLCAIGGLGIQMMITNGLANPLVDGSLLASETMPICIGASVLLVVALGLGVARSRSSYHTSIVAGQMCVSFAGVLCARFVFYALALSAGIALIY